MHANTRKKYYLEKANTKLGKIQQAKDYFQRKLFIRHQF